MGMKQNARTAMQELLGHVGIDIDEEKGIPDDGLDTAPVETEECEQDTSVVVESTDARVSTAHRLIATVIGADTRIDGSIVSQAPLEIYGSVNGNVTTTDSVSIRGGVIGDVHGNSVSLAGCRVRGNIASGTSIVIDKDSILVGDLTGDRIEIDGKVKGNVTATSTVETKNNGIVVGDVTAGHFVMAPESRIVGNVHLNRKSEGEIDINSVFAF